MPTTAVIAVGVERGGEPALAGTQLAHHEVGGLQGDTTSEFGTGGTPEVGVDAAEEGVVVEHLLEVGYDPVTVDGVTGETAAELVVDAAARHALAGVLRHLEGALGAGAGVVAQQELDDHGRRELGRPAEAAAPGVVVAGETEEGLRELLLARGAAVSVGDLASGEIPHDLPGDLGDLVPPVGPGTAHALQDLPEGGHAVPGLGREVRAEVEGLGVRREEDGHGPAALPGGGLYGLHVDSVNVGALLAVDLDVHEVLVEIRGRRLVLEGLVGHDVTPVTAAVADAQQEGYAPLAGLFEGLGRPGPPVDGIVGVLEQIRGRLMGQSVHPSTLPRPRVSHRCAGPPGAPPRGGFTKVAVPVAESRRRSSHSAGP
ncbi:hypothetical protein SAV14893_026040 [Streptomyces avermitilis]|uniref:Uncharacterized protein n=1 Tax=Streptomyces avermitilis TaxID=33903 RepID=A0A4D4LNQ7_STRAX|nr:hypothetical protein SAV14893_026040 [Streptomyces avermitilis]